MVTEYATPRSPVGPEIQNHVLIIVSRVMLVIRSKSKVQFFLEIKVPNFQKKRKNVGTNY
jgi:hypothetical protein